MLILHISDIHFKKGEAGSEMDLDHHLRNVLVRDARSQCQALGRAPDAVLFSGDIAFAGAQEEYAFAQTWLEELCSACGCATSAVFVVPGNHDVQQDVSRKLLIQALHNEIKAIKDVKKLPGKLRQYLTDKDSGQKLYESISNFNNFAAQYFCDLFPPDRTTVDRRFTLNDGSVLCVTGLNSSFVSSHTDQKQSLYVDPSALRITHEDGVTRLVVCHHPFDWLANGRELEDHLNAVTQIQLFGHEHTNRVQLNRDWFRIAASAAHPDRTEDGWEPGYNLLDLSVETSGGQRFLNVKAHVRIWQNHPGQFVAKMDGQVNHFFQSIKLEPWVAPEAELPAALAPKETEIPLIPTNAVIEEDASMTSLRALSIRFFKMTLSKKLEIARRLSLFEDADTKLPDHERFRQVLLRARERRLLREFEAELNDAEQNLTQNNEKEG